MTFVRYKRRNEIKKAKEKGRRKRHAIDDCECPDYNILYTTTMRTERRKKQLRTREMTKKWRERDN